MMAVEEPRKKFICLMSLNVQGRYRWINDVLSILDTGGCENLIDLRFASKLGLTIHVDRSESAAQGATSVSGSSISFTQYVLLNCNFNGARKVIRFYVRRNLPQDLLIGQPALQYDLGAILNLVDGFVSFKFLGVEVPLISSDRRRDHYNTFATFDVAHPAPTPGMADYSLDFMPSNIMQPYSSDIHDFLGSTNPLTEVLEEDDLTAGNLSSTAALFDVPVNAKSLLNFSDAFDCIDSDTLDPMTSDISRAMDTPIFGQSLDYTSDLPDMIAQFNYFESDQQQIVEPPDHSTLRHTDDLQISEDDLALFRGRLDGLFMSYSDRFDLRGALREAVSMKGKKVR